jgi:hypothetical protein
MEKEIWVDVTDYEGYYQISNHGRLKSIERRKLDGGLVKEKIMKQQLTRGYPTTLLSKDGIRKPHRIHRLVAKAFVYNPNPENFKMVNHIDGITDNNYYKNLEWCDDLHNVRHAIANNLRQHSSAQKLMISDIPIIRNLYDTSNISISELAYQYNISTASLRLVLKYISYSDIEPEKKYTYKINSLTGNELKDFLKSKIRRRSPKKYNIKSILEDYVNGLSITEIKTKNKINSKQLNLIISENSLPELTLLENEFFIDYFSYKISNLGRVFNSLTKRIESIKMINNKPLHRIYASIFVPNPNNYAMLKIVDENPLNLSISNFQWYAYNIHQEKDNIIYDYIHSPLPKKELCIKYNIGIISLGKICKGLKRLNVKNNENRINASLNNTLTNKDNIIYDYINTGMNKGEIANKYNVSPMTVTELCQNHKRLIPRIKSNGKLISKELYTQIHEMAKNNTPNKIIRKTFNINDYVLNVILSN